MPRLTISRVDNSYIAPLTIRTRMAELFKDPTCVRWWLPNDEGFTPFLQSIRIFADERNATAASAQSTNLRQIRHVFSRMRLGGAGYFESNKDPGYSSDKGKDAMA
jgi:hypothetical protein